MVNKNKIEWINNQWLTHKHAIDYLKNFLAITKL